MPLIKVRRAAQITLPSEIREALKVREGDYIEAAVREGEVVLRPVSVVDRDKAGQELEAILARVQPAKGVDEDEVLQASVDEASAVRREWYAKGRS